MNWIEIICNCKNKSVEIQDFISATEFREIERWLNFNHSIEEIFENKNNYCDVVRKELEKFERRKKIYKLSKINENKKKMTNEKKLQQWTELEKLNSLLKKSGISVSTECIKRNILKISKQDEVIIERKEKLKKLMK